MSQIFSYKCVWCCCHHLHIRPHWWVHHRLLNQSHWGMVCFLLCVLLLQTTNIPGPKCLCTWIASLFLTVNYPILWPSCLKVTWHVPVVLITIFPHDVWILLFQILSTGAEPRHQGSRWKGKAFSGVAGANTKLLQGSFIYFRVDKIFLWRANYKYFRLCKPCISVATVQLYCSRKVSIDNM